MSPQVDSSAGTAQLKIVIVTSESCHQIPCVRPRLQSVGSTKGGNPAGNATLTDPAFVAPRFRIVQSRVMVPQPAPVA